MTTEDLCWCIDREAGIQLGSPNFFYYYMGQQLQKDVCIFFQIFEVNAKRKKLGLQPEVEEIRVFDSNVNVQYAWRTRSFGRI